MSSVAQIVLALTVAVVFPACHRVAGQASTFNVADPTRSNQLIYGYYGVEAKPSRWTARKFSFALKPPAGSATKGGKLWIRLFVPDLQIRNIGPMTLEASIDGYSLAPQEFTEGGMYVYAAKVPAELLDTNLVPVHCEFDRAAPPSAADNRELGAVLTEVGLQAN
jgi:hypothetical protein